MLAAVDGLVKKIRRLVVGRDEDVHVRPCIVGNCGERMLSLSEEVTVQDERFDETQYLNDEEHDVHCDSQRT